MPITPHFELSQTPTHVTVDIRVPHVRVSADTTQVLVDDDSNGVLHFSSPPYLLVLHFPAAVKQQEEHTTAKYDPVRQGGMITITLEKQEAEIWRDLDLVATLMPTKKQSSIQQPLRATIISEERNGACVEENDEENDEAQQPTTALSSLLDGNLIAEDSRPHYGFAHHFTGIFTDLAREGLAAAMLQLPNPDLTSPSERTRLRLQQEQDDFCPDRYLGDLDIQDDYIHQCAMSMEPHWASAANVNDVTKQLSELSTSAEDATTTTSSTRLYFTKQETAQLASISYPILNDNQIQSQHPQLLLGLLDILFAYVYDYLLTQGEPTVESSWTVCTLSTLLSWLDDDTTNDDNIKSVVQSGIKRCLIYPYLRNYHLAVHCWKQVLVIVQNGRRCVVRCLLHVQTLLDKSEFHYLGNKLFIDPYLLWIQKSVRDDELQDLGSRLEATLSSVDKDNVTTKEALGLNLIELEKVLLESDNDELDSSESDTDSDEQGEGTTDDDESAEETRKQSPSLALLDTEIGKQGSLSLLNSTGKPKEPIKSQRPLIEEL